MTSTQRRALWGGTITIGVLLIAAGAYWGLEKANAISGVVSAITGIVGVSIGIHQLLSSGPSAGNAAQSQQSGANSVNIQGGRDVTFGDSNQVGR